MIETSLSCACIQTNSGPDMERNIRQATAMIEEAGARGARFIALPETVDLIDSDNERLRSYAQPVSSHPAVEAFRAAARTGRIWLLVGSVTARNEANRIVNRSLLIDPQGEIFCHYDKIHLFDVDVEKAVYHESDVYAGGGSAVVARTGWGGLGLSICYDLRFPQLFRALAQAGANILAVPAAFFEATGQAHWHVLMRTRAIENLCFVVAPAQCGLHYGTRRSFGHSLIVDPWGRVLADAGTSEGIIYAQLDLSEVEPLRRKLPCLSHDRKFTVRTV